MHLRNQLAPVVGALLVLAGLALGQDPRGALRGVVTDQSKAVIPNVEVRATNVATGVTVSAQTNEAGSYSIPFLPSAIYDVSAELQGFKKFVQAGVQIRVAETTELNIAMDVGTVAETLEVNEATPLLDTASSSLGQVIDERRILELPLAAGNPLELVLLTPGMVEPSKFLWKAAWNFRNVTSDGNPAYTTEYTIDGVSNTFAEGNLGRSRYAFAPPATAIREVKMQTAAYDASVGHTLSSVVNVATISGTNSLHGEAHWTVRNQAFDAPNFFNNKNKTLMPGQPLRRVRRRTGPSAEALQRQKSHLLALHLGSEQVESPADVYRYGPHRGPAARRLLRTPGDQQLLPDLRSVDHRRRAQRPIQPPTLGRQCHSGQPPRPRGSESRQALSRG